MAEATVRQRFDDSLGIAEMAIYSVLAVLLSLSILAAIGSACNLLFDSVVHRTVWSSDNTRVFRDSMIELGLLSLSF